MLAPGDGVREHSCVIVVVMGVSGVGKSTVGVRLAALAGAHFIEGDDHHPPENVAKMSVGIPLTDDDRWPWLDRLSRAACDASRGGDCVLTCSALKRRYRDRLVQGCLDESWRFVHLDAPRELIERRMNERHDHFMPTTLLASQLDALERPGADEPALELDVSGSLDDAIHAAAEWLGLDHSR